MAFDWRFIVESELRAGGICVWSTARWGDSRSRPGPTTCWGNSPIGGQAKIDPRTITMNWRSQMTLIKSILLGSAAGIVAVATAQAADLPTRKAAPVEYVRVCSRRRRALDDPADDLLIGADLGSRCMLGSGRLDFPPARSFNDRKSILTVQGSINTRTASRPNEPPEAFSLRNPHRPLRRGAFPPLRSGQIRPYYGRILAVRLTPRASW